MNIRNQFWYPRSFVMRKWWFREYFRYLWKYLSHKFQEKVWFSHKIQSMIRKIVVYDRISPPVSSLRMLGVSIWYKGRPRYHRIFWTWNAGEHEKFENFLAKFGMFPEW